MSKQINTTYYDENGEMLYFLTQWDSNRQVTIKVDEKITSTPEVHFFNKTTNVAIKSTSVIFNSSKNEVNVVIPNVLLKSPNAIYLYVYFTNAQGVSKTETFVRIPVRKRPKPSDYVDSEITEIVYLENKISEYKVIVDRLERLNANTLITNASSIVNEYENMIATPNETRSYLGIR